VLRVRLLAMTLLKQAAVLVALAAAVIYFAIRARRLYRLLRLGPNENRFDHVPLRLLGVAKYVGLHTRMFRNLYSGILHIFIFYGFVVLLTAIIQAFGEGLYPGFSLAWIGGNTWLAFLQDLFGLLVLVGVAMAAINRAVIRPRQFHESNELDAAVILALIAAIMVGMLGQNAARVARGDDPSAAWRPVSSAIARGFESIGWQGSAAIVPHEVFYWIHILAVLAFLVYIPSSKHLHIIVAIPNIFFRKLGPKPAAALDPIDLEHADHYGTSVVTQWSWKHLLDLYSCTECGRCQEQCPAYLTGKPLNPKMIIVDARENLFQTARHPHPDPPPEGEGEIAAPPGGGGNGSRHRKGDRRLLCLAAEAGLGVHHAIRGVFRLDVGVADLPDAELIPRWTRGIRACWRLQCELVHHRASRICDK